MEAPPIDYATGMRSIEATVPPDLLPPNVDLSRRSTKKAGPAHPPVIRGAALSVDRWHHRERLISLTRTHRGRYSGEIGGPPRGSLSLRGRAGFRERDRLKSFSGDVPFREAHA